MYARSLRLAGGLAELGVCPGDRIAIWVPNWLEGALTYQAALLLGAVVVPIIHIYGPREVANVAVAHDQSGRRVPVDLHLFVVQDFPRSLSGKVRKVELRERLKGMPS